MTKADTYRATQLFVEATKNPVSLFIPIQAMRNIAYSGGILFSPSLFRCPGVLVFVPPPTTLP